MTKPMNFPGRRQERRIRALARMKKALSNMEAVNASDNRWWIRYTDTSIFNLRQQIKNTEENIATGGIKQTKKRRDTGLNHRNNGAA